MMLLQLPGVSGNNLETAAIYKNKNKNKSNLSLRCCFSKTAVNSFLVQNPKDSFKDEATPTVKPSEVECMICSFLVYKLDLINMT